MLIHSRWRRYIFFSQSNEEIILYYLFLILLSMQIKSDSEVPLSKVTPPSCVFLANLRPRANRSRPRTRVFSGKENQPPLDLSHFENSKKQKSHSQRRKSLES